MELKAAAGPIVIRLCGEAAVEGDGRVISMGKKTLALLGYLLAEPGTHSRRHLSSLLWSEVDDARSATSLRQALTRMREILGARLVTDRTSVRVLLDSGNDAAHHVVQCDVLDFQRLIEGDVWGATRIDVHRAFEACRIDDAPEFEHWLDRTREQLTRKAIAALSRVAQEHAARRDWSIVARAAERWQQFDALSEDAVRLAIEAAYMRRDVSAAMRLHEDFDKLCLDRLGAAPSEKLVALRRRFEAMLHATPARGVSAVRAADDGAGRDRVAETSAATSAAAPLTLALRERDGAWAAVSAALRDVRRSGRAHQLVVQGDTGTGRSRLLQDVSAWASGMQLAVLASFSASPSSSLAYSTIASLVRALIDVPALAGIDERHLRVLGQLAPELEQRFPSLRRDSRDFAVDDRFAWALQLAMHQAIEAMAEDSLVMCVIDDADFCDAESGRVLQHLIDALAAHPVLWVFAGATAFAKSAGHPFWADLERQATVVPLTPLGAESIRGMLAEVSGETHDWMPLVDRVHAATHGAPAYVSAVLDDLSSRLGDDWAAWRIAEVPVPRLAPRQRDRIRELDDVCETMLLSLAVMMEDGHPVPLARWAERPAATVDQLSHILGISRLRAALLGERLAAARVAIQTHNGFRCASPVVAEHLLRQASPLMLSELRAAIRLVTTPS